MLLSTFELHQKYAAFFKIKIKIKKQETIDFYATKLLQKSEIISTNSPDASKLISVSELCKTFLYGLPPNFTPIKQNLENNPACVSMDWKSKDIEHLIGTNKNYLKSVHLIQESNRDYKGQQPDPRSPTKTQETGGGGDKTPENEPSSSVKTQNMSTDTYATHKQYTQVPLPSNLLFYLKVFFLH